MLPITLAQSLVNVLMKDAEEGGELEIDLPNQSITRPNGEKIHFEIEAFRKHCLVNGLDDIGLTLQKQQLIKS
jgi:3-isopropylmalate dehydratase small subunit